MTEVLIFLNIMILEIVLSIDNAAVLAAMVKELPKNQQKKALTYGIAGASF
jgi:predicted tellurium resistance membrane protein TerC